MKNTAGVCIFASKLFVYNTMSFGEWLRKNIEDRGLSNREVARRADVSATYIGNLVRDFSQNTRSGKVKPSEDVVERIAFALDADLNEARTAAGYSSNGPDSGLFDGIRSLSPENQRLARRQIKAIIDALAEEENPDTDYIEDENYKK